MLNTSLNLILAAAIDKAGLKLKPSNIHEAKGEQSFPIVIFFSAVENTLHPFATKAYQHLVPERMSCDLCQKKIMGECSGLGEHLLCRETL